jgi:D-amino-acid dehydrogenase
MRMRMRMRTHMRNRNRNRNEGSRMALRVVVVGAGIVGASCAIELRRVGYEVVLLDAAKPGGEQAASYGNGAWLSPSSVVPMSMPGLWKKIPGYLLDPLGPITIRWRALPRLMPWLVRFVLAGASVKKVRVTARALSALLADAPARHLALARDAGAADLIEQAGLLYAYADRRAFEADALSWDLRRENGVQWHELPAAALRERVPQLDHRYGFGVWVESGAHCVDPGAYVAALVAYAERLGVTFLNRDVRGLDIADGRLRGVSTAAGAIACDRAVIAAGVHSKKLARDAGDVLALESERGYHVSIADSGISLAIPVMPTDGRMANTSTRAGFRVAGQVELCSIADAPNWRRADILLAHAKRAYPTLRATPANVTRWMGHRPSSADGLPYIGQASGCGDVFHAFGHGHIGLAAGPITGKLIADLVGGKQPEIDPAPYRAKRV